MEAGWTTLPCPATNWSILICNHLQGQSVISVGLKTSLPIRLGICLYKTSLLHWPDDYIGFKPSCLPHFTTKLRPWTWAKLYEKRLPCFSRKTSCSVHAWTSHPMPNQTYLASRGRVGITKSIFFCISLYPRLWRRNTQLLSMFRMDIDRCPAIFPFCFVSAT